MENTITHIAMDTQKKEHKVALHYPSQQEISTLGLQFVTERRCNWQRPEWAIQCLYPNTNLLNSAYTVSGRRGKSKQNEQQ